MSLCQNQIQLLSRRSVLQNTACGFGWLALSALMAKEGLASSSGGSKSSGAHFPAKAKRVIFLYMKGGPSHVDTFDYKPELEKADGQTGPRPGSKWMKSPWKFQQHGQSGLWISDLFPELSKTADDMLIVNSMQTEVPAHAQATIRMHTGTSQFVRPSVGSWVLYGLGAENESIPGFISIGASGSAQNYGNAFLPAYYQGMRLGNGNREVDETQIANLSPLVGSERQRRELDFIQGMNQKKLQNDPGDQEIEGVIRSYEMAYRMQTELPKVLDIKSESQQTKELYGLDRKDSKGFGSKCLVARRMIEAGVRFVEISQGSWDHHSNLNQNLTNNCSAIDRPMYGLITDLKQRGLLDETLIVWAGEFGRTPYAQGRDGRDHNHKAFSLWMAGGGVAAGKQYGRSGDFGAEATENPVPIVDFHATLLALLGLDHEQLTYPYAGRDFRLTETKGQVVKELIA